MTISLFCSSLGRTCAVPRFYSEIERPKIFPNDQTKDNNEWNLLYTAAEALIGMSEKEYDKSIRHNAVLRALKEAKPKLPFANDENVIFKPLPLACHRLAEGSPYVQWHSAENVRKHRQLCDLGQSLTFFQVYGDMFTNPKKKNKKGVQRGYFRLLTNTQCKRLHPKTPLASARANIELGIASVAAFVFLCYLADIIGSARSRTS